MRNTVDFGMTRRKRPGGPRELIVPIRVDQAERDLLTTAAAIAGTDVSTWARAELVKAAHRLEAKADRKRDQPASPETIAAEQPSGGYDPRTGAY
jgi:hypothetical protein